MLLQVLLSLRKKASYLVKFWYENKPFFMKTKEIKERKHLKTSDTFKPLSQHNLMLKKSKLQKQF